ncbi:hypothetical protein CapIbe_009338 [Capra ibex]
MAQVRWIATDRKRKEKRGLPFTRQGGQHFERLPGRGGSATQQRQTPGSSAQLCHGAPCVTMLLRRSSGEFGTDKSRPGKSQFVLAGQRKSCGTYFPV